MFQLSFNKHLLKLLLLQFVHLHINTNNKDKDNYYFIEKTLYLVQIQLFNKGTIYYNVPETQSAKDNAFISNPKTRSAMDKR